MYKLSEVAQKLNIETVLIFELLISKSQYLDKYVMKKYGVTYIDDTGVKIIDALVNGEEELALQISSSKIIDSIIEDSTDNDEDNMIKDTSEIKDLTIEGDCNNQENPKEVESLKNRQIDLNNIEKFTSLEKKFTESLRDNEEIFNNNNHNPKRKENYLNDEENIDIDDSLNQNKQLKEKKEKLKERITQIRSELISLDLEIQRKTEAIQSYYSIIEDDIKWICILEDKLDYSINDCNTSEKSNYNLVNKLFTKKT